MYLVKRVFAYKNGCSPLLSFSVISLESTLEWKACARDQVKCELRVASCELQKLTLYHNIYLQSFSTLKIAFKLHDLSYCTCCRRYNTAVGLYVKCHTGVAVGLFTRINKVFRCWHLRSRLPFFLHLHKGCLNDSINRHFTVLLGYDTALTLRMQNNLFHAFSVVCWLFFF